MKNTRYTRLLLVGGIMLGLMGLMFLSVDPEIQYTVDEVMDSPESHDSGELNVRGIVQDKSLDSSSSKFILAGEESQIEVFFASIAVPDGFEEGRMVAVKGHLKLVGNIWHIEANEIQTGCPSKYETE